MQYASYTSALGVCLTGLLLVALLVAGAQLPISPSAATAYVFFVPQRLPVSLGLVAFCGPQTEHHFPLVAPLAQQEALLLSQELPALPERRGTVGERGLEARELAAHALRLGLLGRRR